MKGKAIILFIVLLFLAMYAGKASAVKKRIIEFHNAYGGITTEGVYSKGEKTYEEGIREIINYYAKPGADGVGRLRKIIYIHTEAHYRKNGFSRTVILPGADGSQRSVTLYDKSGKLIYERNK